MTMTSPALSLFPREQFRMVRLQVYNWGTFSGLHDIPIAERGFLFVGRSGAGKSTLLDAIATLIVPPRWLDFNAAAREAERAGRDRSLATYVRGAWAEQTDVDSGEIASRTLRPGTTWSALALTYRTSLGQTVVLAQVFWIRGNSNNSADVKRHYFVFEREFDLREFEAFGRSDLDIRKLKQSFPEAFAREEFSGYRERFCRLLGIESEMALRLLHKTQSAKNLGDLNAFLRDFMLDKPETFTVAERLVGEFGELQAAHQAVVTAREQVETLAPARERYRRLELLWERRRELKDLRQALNAYTETRRMALIEERIAALSVRVEGLAGEVRRREEALANQQALLRDLERQHREMGGDRIEQWEDEKRRLEAQRSDRLQRRAQAEDACRKLGWTLPDAPGTFAELVGRARREIEDWQRRKRETRERRDGLVLRKQEAEKERDPVLRELEALRRQPSNLPAEMLELRRDLAAALGIAEGCLPFVGELLQVKPEEASWRGAVERVLHGFALSLLVDEHHYGALAQHLNATHLGRRLVYYRTVRPDARPDRPLAPDSLVLKLDVKEGAHADWLRAQLRERFDYACVESVSAFRAAERALTREGQVKHSRTRHEKDDRSRVDDRRHWVLGFDNREKRELFERQLGDLAVRIAGFEREIAALDEEEDDRGSRALHCQVLANMSWGEMDVSPLQERLAHVDRLLREAREGDAALRRIAEALAQQRGAVDEAERRLRDARDEQEKVLGEIRSGRERLEVLRRDPAILPLTKEQSRSLDERFARVGEAVQLDNLDRLARLVIQSLADEAGEVDREVAECEKIIESRFADFRRRWPVEAAELDASLDAAPDYLAKLTRLETDGLPAYEQRFFDLLQNQSTQNLAALATHLNQARKAILERMEIVNRSLSRVEFNPGTHLRIEVGDRQLPEVREFKQEIQQVLSHAWSDDREVAEARFLALRRLVERLGSQDAEMRRWREAVLDVRQHVEFIGREFDAGGVEVEVYRSGAGKSGGQRQKLATTCLAAALRYQLGGDDHGVPIYAPVVLDEAFDKADNEFTALAMNIFTNFGFQMVVATPLKSVMTLEPFIGGACFVDIRDRRVSSVLLVEYDDDLGRLNLPEPARREAAVETS